MKILLVDDSNDKIAGIVKVIRNTIPNGVEVETVIDVHSALKRMEDIQYDLLIVDLQLPMRQGLEPQIDGGQILIHEVERKPKFKSPKYVLATTQFDKIQNQFHEIWRVIIYSGESSWQKSLEKFIKHINKASTIASENSVIKPTLFVEGTSDETILREAFSIFQPDNVEKIEIRTINKGGGAAWVANQVVAWAHLFHKDKNGNPIKCVGLFDGDQPGLEGRKEVIRTIPKGSEMIRNYKLICLSANYAKHIIPLYQKGLKIPVTLEEMFSPEYWQMAREKGWLVKRTDADSFLEDPKKWNKFEESLLHHIDSLGITGGEKVYLDKFDSDYKSNFANLIVGLDEEAKATALSNFENLVKEISDVLTG